MKKPHSEGVAKYLDSGADPIDRRGRQHRPSRYRKRRANPARSQTPCTSGNSPHENRETSAVPAAKWRAGGERRKPHAPRARRRGVGAGGSTDERFEQKRHAAGGEPGGKQPRPTSVNANENVQRPRTDRARQRAAVSQGLEGVRRAARRKATGKFTSLLHHLTPELPRSSFYALKRQAAAGVDGVSTRAESETAAGMGRRRL